MALSAASLPPRRKVVPGCLNIREQHEIPPQWSSPDCWRTLSDPYKAAWFNFKHIFIFHSARSGSANKIAEARNPAALIYIHTVPMIEELPFSKSKGLRRDWLEFNRPWNLQAWLPSIIYTWGTVPYQHHEPRLTLIAHRHPHDFHQAASAQILSATQLATLPQAVQRWGCAHQCMSSRVSNMPCPKESSTQFY